MKRYKSFVCLGAALGLAVGGLATPAIADTTEEHTEWISDDGGSAGRELPVMSANGQYVVFVARSSAYQGVWIKDRLQPAKPAWKLWAGAAFNPAISADGSTVAWAKYGTGEGGQSIMLLRWKQTSDAVVVSVSDTGRPAGAPTDFPSLSGNGNLVAFQSMDPDLDDDVEPDRSGGGPTKVYVRDLVAGETEMVSVVDRETGDTAVNGNALKPDITPDGRYVAFASDASVLQGGEDESDEGHDVSVTAEEPAEEASFQQVYVRDLREKTTLPASALGAGDTLVFGDGAAATSYGPSISDDGTLVAFESDATNLVAGDTNEDTDAFVKNMTSGEIERVSVMADGSEADILADGTTEEPVASLAAAPTEPGQGNGGGGGNGGGDSAPDATPNVGLGPVLSGDGAYVAFESKAALTGDDQNGGMATCTDAEGTTTEYVEPADIYKYRMSDETLVRESVANETGTADGVEPFEATGFRTDGMTGLCVPVNNGVDAAISGDGSKVAFVSNGNLVGRVVEEEDSHETDPAASAAEVTTEEDLVENLGIEPSVYLHHPAGDTTSPEPPPSGGGGTTPPPSGGGGALPPTDDDVTPPPEPSVDETAPVSRAKSPRLARKLTFPVTYTAQDDGGSGVESVALFAKGPGEAAFTKVATDSGAAVDGRFRYVAAGEGVVELYTVATDEAGNVEAAPALADTRTRVDTTAPMIRRRMGPGPSAFDIGEERRLEIRYRVNERVRTRFAVRQAGEVVKRSRSTVEPRGLVTKYWFGKAAGEVVPSGRYVLVIKARDMAGNLAAVRIRLRVSR